ncbi:hypothetical protein CGLAMM_05440 [Acetobacteraceae bacterium EV16G]|uniref:Uncharacterized protein n=1 Tax=Sorlinia euscelidii TaxID=3081148 RepID=A0ABU7U2I0_9PROT
MAAPKKNRMDIPVIGVKHLIIMQSLLVAFIVLVALINR